MNDNSKPRWFKRTWLVATAASLIGIGIGAASMSSQDVTKTPEFRAVAAEQEDTASALSGTEEELEASQAEVAELQAAVAELQAKLTEVEGTIPAREQAVTAKEAQLKRREATLTASERDVRRREKAVGIIEREIEANTVSDGLYEVGADIKAGTYKTKGSGDTCYWSRLTSPSGDIKANNLGSGPSVVTVFKGDYLELNCGGADWVLQR